MIAQATGGTISVTGEKGRQPVKPGLSLGDTGTGMTMAITILGALRKRDKTGEGCRLQVAMQDAMLHYMRTNFSTQARTGKAVERDGTRSGGGSNAPSGLYPCAPGGPNDYVWIMTSRANPEHWARLCKVMGREDLINDPRFATPALRVKNDAELDPIIRAWTSTRTKHEAMALVGGAGIPAGAVLDTMELQNDPTLRATRHHAGDGAQALRRSRCRPGRCASTASRRGSRRRRAGRAHRGCADRLAWVERGGHEGVARRRGGLSSDLGGAAPPRSCRGIVKVYPGAAPCVLTKTA